MGLRIPAPAAYAASAALHAALFALLARVPAPPPLAEAVKVDIVETERPAPAPAPAPPDAPARAAPAPPLEAPRRPPPPRRVAVARTPPPPHDAPSREVPPDAPPPPNAPPPQDAPGAPRAPVRIGVNMSATAQGGSFAAPVGNSLYGEVPRTAGDPSEARPYRSDRYVAPTQVTSLPRPISCSIPQSEYPRDALQLGLEGKVVLRLLVDETGRVVEASAIQDPGHGMGEAAVRGAKAHCRFQPARRGPDAVATWLSFTVRFELP